MPERGRGARLRKHRFPICREMFRKLILVNCNSNTNAIFCQCGVLLPPRTVFDSSSVSIYGTPCYTLFRVLTASGIASGGGGVFGGYSIWLALISEFSSFLSI